MKDISRTLADLKRDTFNTASPANPNRRGDDEPTREPRDPDVWPPPTPVERER